MTTLSIVEARNNLADAINRVTYGGERVVFARRGKPVAALVSAGDLALLQRLEDAEDLRAALAGAMPGILTGGKAARMKPADELAALAAKVAASAATNEDKARLRVLAAKV